ncbi:glycosyltransferase family 2 protein [Spirosoma aerophilum]
MFLYYIALILAAYLIFNVLYILILAIAGALGKADDSEVPTSGQAFKKMAVLVPAYKEDSVIINSVEVNLKQNYPKEFFDIYVIADSFQASTLATLRKLPITVLEVSFDFSTVTKALNSALSRLPENTYDVVVVSDADNHMAPDFLSRVNTAFQQGWRAVQGHRVAKNTNTQVAFLDAISEEISNHLFRKGYRSLNLSASIIGSGMAIDFQTMKTAMTNLLTVGGFDKELEMKLAINGCKIGYLEQAYIYDEKVTKRSTFESQRTRWIAAQWQFLCYYFKQGMRALLTGRMVVASKTLQAMLLPKVLMLGVISLAVVVSLLSGSTLFIALFSGLLGVLCVGLFISIPSYLLKRLSVRDLLTVGILMLSFARATFNIRKAYKSFIHTPHGS